MQLKSKTLKMPYEDDPTWTSDISNKMGPSKSRSLANSSVLGKRGERNGSDEPEQAANNRKKAKAKISQYTGVSLSSSSKRYRTQFSYRRQTHIGTFMLQADAAKAYDHVLRVLPRRSGKGSAPNFANEELYQAAREKEIRERHEHVKSKMTLDSFLRQCTPKFLNETQIFYKFGLIPSDSNGRLRDRVQKEDDDNDHQGFLADDGKEHFANDSSDDEADLRKAKKQRVSPESKLPNNGRQSTEKEVIDLVSSDEEDNDESISISRAVPVESVKSTSMNRTESVTASINVKVGEEIWQLTSKTNDVHSEVPENRPATEQNQASTINEMSAAQVSPTHNTTTNLDNAHLVLKEPLMQLLGIQDMEEVITEYYCKTLCKKGYGNEQYLKLEILKGLSENALEKMLDFMQPLHILGVKKRVRDHKREASEELWI